MNKKLNLLHKKIRICKKCNLWKTRGHAVPGEGSSNAKIMFIGLSPGGTENEQGRPFVGRAGKLLNELLVVARLKRKNIFITSILKCHPPRNILPKSNEIKSCKPYLHKQIEIVNPKIIVLLGNVAIKTILGKMDGINKIHSKAVRRNGRIYFLTFHPAAGIRSTTKKQLLRRDFKKLKRIID